MPPRIAVFTGAGAEVGYGMPSGGQFALEIFRRKDSKEKELFRQLRDNIDRKSIYATSWLPKKYPTARISAFGASEKSSIFRSSLEYNRGIIISRLEKFDALVTAFAERCGVDLADIDAMYQASAGTQIGAILYSHEVEINESLAKDADLFSSVYFSASLNLLKLNPDDLLLEKYLRSILQLYVGCLGNNLTAALNQGIFSKAPEDISIFDDVGGIFQIELSQAGLSAYEMVMERPSSGIDISKSVAQVFADILHGCLELLMAECLDYQSLIDDHFRYLYKPCVEWAKFSKISIFLYVARSYILEKYASASAKASATAGFYHDIAAATQANIIELCGVGTANYTNIMREVFGRSGVGDDIFHLNGSINDFYDPYRNLIAKVSDADLPQETRFLVPFIFTQSGIKPLTSVEVSQRYVEFSRKMEEADAVVVAGFGFNGDDGHINGLFRRMIDQINKPVYVTEYCGQVISGFSEAKKKQELARKIRIDTPSKLTVVPVDAERKTVGGTPWLDWITQHLSASLVPA
ncbi:hypothetical protein [Azospirillum sp. sgz301742]